MARVRCCLHPMPWNPHDGHRRSCGWEYHHIAPAKGRGRVVISSPEINVNEEQSSNLQATLASMNT